MPRTLMKNNASIIRYHVWLIVYVLFLTTACTQIIQAQQVVFNGEKTSWHDGFDRYDFIMDEETLAIAPFKAPDGEKFGVKDPPKGKRRCIVVAPQTPAKGNPWSWQGCYWDHQPQTEIELLHRGFFIAYISASATLRPGKQWDAWYAFLVQHGLSPKPAFVGMSRGGEFEYTWATNHPDKVSCIYADNPAITNDALMKLGDLARYNVPLFHVCGSFDPLYQIATLPIENIYQSFGGRISVMIKEGFGHHPHSLRNPKPIADFMEQSVQEIMADTPRFVNGTGNKSYYYSNASSYKYFDGENAYITCRGPAFSGCYAKYIFQLAGVESFVTVISPASPAPGNPWVLRCGYLKRDNEIVNALLSKGFYVVIGSVPYNYDGPLLSQWNLIYKHFTDHGFSAKPVINGEGGAAGESIAWAIANAGKVSCIYAENPVLTSKMAGKSSIIERFDSLKQAGVPVLFVSGSLDPSIKEQTAAAAAYYKRIGGKIRVMIMKDEGHYLSLKDPQPVIDFIMMNKN